MRAFFAGCCLAALAAWPGAAEWPEFRGPTGQGLSEAASPPLTWNETENIAWKKATSGLGWSSPAVADGKIWFTAASEQGRSLRALALDVATGDTLHDVEILRLESVDSIHSKNSHASPTPIVADGRVYVHFGARGTAALDASEASLLWRNTEHAYKDVHGSGGSPVLAGDLLIINCDGADRQFVVALDKDSGRTVWASPRGKARMAFATPLLIHPPGGGPQVVSPGADRTVSYDPSDGREIWSISYDGFSNVPRPVYAHGLVYIVTGFYRPAVHAVRPDGNGDVTSTHVAWSRSRGAPLTPSPVVVGDEFYMVNDKGIATCLDARTGEEVWQERLPGAYSTSPVAADGRIYFLNETGEATVIRAGREFEKLASNKIDGRTFASLAFSDGAIFLRSDTHLYRIEP